MGSATGNINVTGVLALCAFGATTVYGVQAMGVGGFFGNLIPDTGMSGAAGLAMSIGMFLIASPLDAWWTLWVAVSLMGLSQGAEGDLAGYLVVRHFGVGIFSSVLGLIIAALGVASSLGALLLSL